MRYYGIQFKCTTSTTGDQVRYVWWGLEKDGDLSEEDISAARAGLDRCEGIDIIDFHRTMEVYKAEWDEAVISKNGATK